MYAQFNGAIVMALQGNRVVEIPGIGRINRDDRAIGQVLTAFHRRFRIKRLRRPVRVLQRGRAEFLCKAVLLDDALRIHRRLTAPAEHLHDDPLRLLPLVGIANDLHHHLVARPRILRRHIRDPNRRMQRVPVRNDQPSAQLFLKLPHKPRLPAVENRNHAPLVEHLAVAFTALQHFRRHRIARDRPARSAHWNEQIAVPVWRFRHHEPESALIAAENPHDLARRLRQHQRVARTQYNASVLHERFARRMKITLLFIAKVHRFGQIFDLTWRITLGLNKLQYPLGQAGGRHNLFPQSDARRRTLGDVREKTRIKEEFDE